MNKVNMIKDITKLKEIYKKYIMMKDLPEI